MGTAYTPGLKVSPGTIVRKTRRLPLKGEVTVSVGDKVTSDTVVARTEIPGVMQSVRVAEMLGLEPQEAIQALRVKEGDVVECNQLIAESRSFFGLIRSECKCPYAGKVELVSHATGHVGVRLPANPVEVNAYIDGVISEIIPEEGVVIETYGALIQGILGVGGERVGTLKVPASSADVILTEDHIKDEHVGMVLVGGRGVTVEALKKAARIGVSGVVVGAIIDTDLIGYLGHDIGVAITGQEDIGTTLIITEGFGQIEMADRTYNLLKSLEGRKVSINGATQIRAGVIRPEIVAPLDTPAENQEDHSSGFLLEVGTNIRVIREPYFGELGVVTALPHELKEMESGAVVRYLEAKLHDGRTVSVPRANVEIIES